MAQCGGHAGAGAGVQNSLQIPGIGLLRKPTALAMSAPARSCASAQLNPSYRLCLLPPLTQSINYIYALDCFLQVMAGAAALAAKAHAARAFTDTANFTLRWVGGERQAGAVRRQGGGVMRVL